MIKAQHKWNRYELDCINLIELRSLTTAARGLTIRAGITHSVMAVSNSDQHSEHDRYYGEPLKEMERYSRVQIHWNIQTMISNGRR